MKRFVRGNPYLSNYMVTVVTLKIFQAEDKAFLYVIVMYMTLSIIYALNSTPIEAITSVTGLLSEVPVVQAFVKSNSDMKNIASYLAGMLISTPILSATLYQVNIRHAKLAHNYSNVKLSFLFIGAILMGIIVIFLSLFITDNFESAPTKTRILYKIFGTSAVGVGIIYGLIFFSASFLFAISFKYAHELRSILIKR